MLVEWVEGKWVDVLKRVFGIVNFPVLGCSIEYGDEVVVKMASCSVEESG